MRDEVIMDNESYDVSTGILYACGVVSQWRVASAAVALFAVVMVSVVMVSAYLFGTKETITMGSNVRGSISC